MTDPAIEYLEADLEHDTAVCYRYQTEDAQYTLTNGTDHASNFQRPIFQIIYDHPGDKANSTVPNPCPACDDFSRSWNCNDHPERRLNLSGDLAYWEGDPGPEDHTTFYLGEY
jgi:hypothetical protein